MTVDERPFNLNRLTNWLNRLVPTLFLCFFLPNFVAPPTSAADLTAEQCEDTAKQLFRHMRAERVKQLLQNHCPNSSLSALLVADASLILGQYQEAAESFEIAKKYPFIPSTKLFEEFALTPTIEALHFQCGYCYCLLGQCRKAIDDLKLAGSDGEELLAYAQAKVAKADSSPVTSSEKSKKPREIDKSEDEPIIKAFHRNTQTTPALVEISISQMFPSQGSQPAWHHATAIAEEGEHLEDCGKFAEASRKYTDAISAYPNDATTLAALALCKFTLTPVNLLSGAGDGEVDPMRDRMAEITQILSRAASLDSTSWRIWNNLAVLQLASGKIKDGVESLNKALECNPPQWAKLIILHASKIQIPLHRIKEEFEKQELEHPPKDDGTQVKG